MVLRVVIFGPGRVGTAFGRRLVAHGAQVTFVGRDARRTAAVAAALGAAVRSGVAPEVHRDAHVVVFAVGDGELGAAIAAARAAAPPRPCSLWLHTSGRFGLDVFDGVPGIRRGALHPVAPFAAREHAGETMVGAPAVIEGEARAMRLLRQLCRRLDLVPIEGRPGDRNLYHAACALAANGATALFAAASDALAAADVVAPAAARELVAVLMRAAIGACVDHGPRTALSGPIRRGDAAAVAAHLERLRVAAPAAVPLYVAAGRSALRLASADGLPDERAAAIAAVLARAVGETTASG